MMAWDVISLFGKLASDIVVMLSVLNLKIQGNI